MELVIAGAVEVEVEAELDMGIGLRWRHSSRYLPQLRLSRATVEFSVPRRVIFEVRDAIVVFDVEVLASTG